MTLNCPALNSLKGVFSAPFQTAPKVVTKRQQLLFYDKFTKYDNLVFLWLQEFYNFKVTKDDILCLKIECFGIFVQILTKILKAARNNSFWYWQNYFILDP